MTATSQPARAGQRVAIIGNPNVGKTSLFNGLTGSRRRVGNYPGVTVERRSGWARSDLGASGDIELVDLPGCYSLTPYSEDEAVAHRELAGAEGARPDAVIVVLDATNLARNLYLLLQVAELGLPIVVALNMVDIARRNGIGLDAEALRAQLGCPVVETVAREGGGLDALVRGLEAAAPVTAGAASDFQVPSALASAGVSPERARALLAARATEGLEWLACTQPEIDALAAVDLEAAFELLRVDVARRYERVEGITRAAAPAGTEALEPGQPAKVRGSGLGVAPAMAASARVDSVVTHWLWGPLIFVGVMALVFQGIFSWADPGISAIESAVGWAGAQVAASLSAGPLTDLLTEGVIAGVGNVVVFVPQIALLFLFIALLEDSGYMARAAFIIDRVMAKVGLNGRAFVPLLSGYACAIPAIMGTRAIRRFRDRLTTILMIPFVSCSARLPIYALVIGALFDADRPVAGPFTLGGLVLLAMYLLSTVSALVMGAIYRRTILKGPTPPLVLELPPYRWPRMRSVLREVADRCMDFLRDAGTIILAATIVLWGLLSYPRPEDPSALEAEGRSAIEVSAGGRLGKVMEPALEPIGQDWRTGIALIGSFAAREVFVSTLGLVYGIEGADEDDAPLREQIASAKRPDGSPRYTPLQGVALMVFFVYACQCMSTLAVVRRETRSWRWTIFMFVSMTVLAYLMSLLVYQGGRLLGWG